MTNLVLSKGKQLLAQSIALLHGPFVREERVYFVSAPEKRAPVSPDGVRRVRHLHELRVPIKVVV